MSDKDYQDKVNGMKGSVLPLDLDYEKLERNSISYPTDNIKGLIVFENSNDFLLIDRVNNTLEDIVQFSQSETQSIKNLTLGGRSGAAGGFVHVG